MKDYQEIRRAADLWASEYAIRRRNLKIIQAVMVVVLIGAIIGVSQASVILLTRAHFSSAEAMKKEMQGRYMCGQYEELVIDGDQVYLTYFNVNDNNLDDAQYNEYTGSYLDDTYKVAVVKWDNLKGVILTEWGTEIKVNKSKNPIYHSATYRKTDEPRNIPRRNKEEAKAQDEKEAESDKNLNENKQEQRKDAKDNLKELQNDLENSASDA